MRIAFLAAIAVIALSSSARAGGNWAVCAAIQQNFNNCAAQQQWQAEMEEWGEWDDWDRPYWRRHRRRAIDCAPWIYALKANNCF
jgi:hypothetical protein